MATNKRRSGSIPALLSITTVVNMLFYPICLAQNSAQTRKPIGTTTPPPGMPPQSPAATPPKETLPEIDTSYDCEQFLITQSIGQGVFSVDGKFYYFSTRVADTPESAVSHRAIYKVDMETGTLDKVLEADINGRGFLIAHGSKLAAISYLGFKDQAIQCAYGHAVGYTVVLVNKAKIIRSYVPGEYQIVPTDSERTVVDLTTGIYKEFDPATLQIRKGEPLKKRHFNLFIDQKSKRFFAWNPEKRSLERYQLLTGVLEAKLPVAEGDTLIQQEGLFAIARLVPDKNRIEIHEDAEWGRRVLKGSITLPKPYKVRDAILSVDLASHVALIYRKAKNKYAQKWDKVILWDFEKDELVSHRLIKVKTYLAQAGLSPGGKRFVIIIQDSLKDLPTQILAYDLIKQQWIKMKTE